MAELNKKILCLLSLALLLLLLLLLAPVLVINAQSNDIGFRRSLAGSMPTGQPIRSPQVKLVRLLGGAGTRGPFGPWPGDNDLPIVQVAAKSTRKFICNGLLVRKSMVLATANCVDKIMNTHKYVVGFTSSSLQAASKGGGSNSTATRWIGIAWACKHPEFELRKSAHHNVGLVVLDKAILEGANKFKHLLLERRRNLGPLVSNANIFGSQAAASSWHELFLVQAPHSTSDSQSHKINHFLGFGGSLICGENNEVNAHRLEHASKQHQDNLCRIQLDASQVYRNSQLCDLESAVALVKLDPVAGGARNSIQARRSLSREERMSRVTSENSILGLVDVSHETLDSKNCLSSLTNKQSKSFELKMINLSRLSSDGQLHRLINYCSKSR